MPEPALHPWNRDFAWVDHATTSLRLLEPEQVRAFDENGYLLLEGAFEAETVAGLVEDFDPIEAQVTAFLRTRDGGRLFIADAEAITFCTHLVTRSERARHFCGSRFFQDLAHDLVGPDARLYWDQAVYKKPEKPRSFPWHQDNGYTFVDPQQYLTCWVALTDATVENGCPLVVPGLHRRGTLAHELTDTGWQCLADPPGVVPVPARSGDVVVFSSLTPHSTGPNLTDGVRKSYIVQLAPDGARALRLPPGGGAPLSEPQDDPGRQFLLVKGGRPTAPASTPRSETDAPG